MFDQTYKAKMESVKNNTSPSLMKSQFGQSSGISLNDVRVHHNSDSPSKMNALAYTETSGVYPGSGEETPLFDKYSPYNGVLQRMTVADAAKDAASHRYRIQYTRYKREGWRILKELNKHNGNPNTLLSAIAEFTSNHKASIFRLLCDNLAEERKKSAYNIIWEDFGTNLWVDAFNAICIAEDMEQAYGAIKNSLDSVQLKKLGEFIKEGLEDAKKVGAYDNFKTYEGAELTLDQKPIIMDAIKASLDEEIQREVLAVINEHCKELGKAENYAKVKDTITSEQATTIINQISAILTSGLKKLAYDSIVNNLTDAQMKSIGAFMKNDLSRTQIEGLYSSIKNSLLPVQKEQIKTQIGGTLRDKLRVALYDGLKGSFNETQKWKIVGSEAKKVSDLLMAGAYGMVGDSFDPDSQNENQAPDSHKFDALTKIANEAKTLINAAGYSQGPHIALAKVDHVIYISINSSYGDRRARADERAATGTVPVGTITSAESPITKEMTNTLLEAKVRQAITDLAVPETPEIDDKKRWINRIKNEMDSGTLQFKVIARRNALTGLASQHGEMIIAEHIKARMADRQKLDALTQITDTSGSQKHRVIRFGGTLEDCLDCNARFYGGSITDSGTYEDWGTETLCATTTGVISQPREIVTAVQTSYTDAFKGNEHLKSVVRSKKGNQYFRNVYNTQGQSTIRKYKE